MVLTFSQNNDYKPRRTKFGNGCRAKFGNEYSAMFENGLPCDFRKKLSREYENG